MNRAQLAEPLNNRVENRRVLRRRRSFPVAVRVAAAVLLYGLLVPVTKSLELAGLWPRILARRPQQGRAAFADYQATEHDVFVCAFHKSGTNWMLQMSVQTAHRGTACFENIHDVVPWPDAPPIFDIAPLRDDSQWHSSPTGLRVIKTHLPVSAVPYSSQARYLCVVRDPKDVFVSSYHFIKALLLGPMMPSVEHYLNLFLSPGFPPGSWAEHLSSWWEARQRPNVLFLTYEQMKADLPDAMRRVATHMGVDLSPEELDSVVRQSTFSHMKQLHLQFEPPMVLPWSRPQGSIVRRGKPGASGELLTPSQQRRIDDYCRAELARLGCDFPYDTAFCGKA